MAPRTANFASRCRRLILTIRYAATASNQTPLKSSLAKIPRQTRAVTVALANWMKQEFNSVEEVIPEDWGWCLMRQHKPCSLWLGCGNEDDSNSFTEDNPPPKGAEVIWQCFAVVKVPLFLGGIREGRYEKQPGENRLRLETSPDKSPIR
jgi:hypothetical protein